MPDKKYYIYDRAQSALAITHHIQNRIVQVMGRGECSAGIANETKVMCADIADLFERMARIDEDGQ